MSGLYVHIPYCRKACHYCDFHFSTILKNKDEMFEALLREIWLRKEEYPENHLETIYFGGGTPSLLSGLEISPLIETVKENFDLAEKAEITLEANPDDLTKSKLQELFAAGINRLSIGCQSFDDEVLKKLNRTHNSAQIYSAVENARNVGFNNISLDLIFALPEMGLEELDTSLNYIGDLNPEHVSIYGLTIEPNTVFSHLLKKGELKLPDEQNQSEQYLLILEKLKYFNYEHYEISNFGKKGFHALHNSMYWMNKPYLGIGPSAHSFYGNRRYWNVANNSKYIQKINSDIIPNEFEELTKRDRHNELILTGLRRRVGLSLERYTKEFGKEQRESLIKEIEPYLEEFVLVENDHLRLTDQGCLLADKISVELFI